MNKSENEEEELTFVGNQGTQLSRLVKLTSGEQILLPKQHGKRSERNY